MGRSKDLVKNTAILTIGKICTQFISFFLLPLYTAILDPDEFGVVDLFNTYITLLVPLVCWQLDQGLFRFMLDAREDQGKINTLFSSVLMVNAVQCVVVALLYMLLAQYSQSEYAVYLIAGVILNVFSALLMQFARGLGKMVNYSVGSFLTATGTVVLNILFIVIFRMGAHGMFLATVGGVAMNCAYLFISLKVWKYFSLKKFDAALVKDLLKYSFPLVPNQISFWVLSASNRSIVSYFLGVAANGVFSVANKFSNLIGTVYGFFNLAWVETISVHFHDEDRDQFISDMMQKVLGLFVSVCVGVIACMPFVFSVMVDGKYADAYPQIPLLIIAIIFQILLGLYSAIYIALKKSAAIATTTILGAIINLIAGVALIKFIGLYAASVSTLLSFATVAIYRIIDVRKYLQIRIPCGFVLLCVAVTLWATVSYYINCTVLNIITLMIVVIFAVYVNRDILVLILKEVKSFIKKS